MALGVSDVIVVHHLQRPTRYREQRFTSREQPTSFLLWFHGTQCLDEQKADGEPGRDERNDERNGQQLKDTLAFAAHGQKQKLAAISEDVQREQIVANQVHPLLCNGK